MDSIVPETFEARMKADCQDAERAIAALRESIAFRDWDGLEDLCYQITDLVGHIESDSRNLVLKQYCSPPLS